MIGHVVLLGPPGVGTVPVSTIRELLNVFRRHIVSNLTHDHVLREQSQTLLRTSEQRT
jgi:hypothetical protein